MAASRRTPAGEPRPEAAAEPKAVGRRLQCQRSALSRAVETASDSTLLWQHVPTRSAILDVAAPALL